MQKKIDAVMQKVNTGEAVLAIYTDELECFNGSGIKPLLDYIRSGKNAKNAVCADKVVGRASAFLFATMEVSFVFAKTLSIKAEEVFIRYNIDYKAEKIVPHIINRTNTGMCPMESLVESITDKNEAYNMLEAKIYKS